MLPPRLVGLGLTLFLVGLSLGYGNERFSSPQALVEHISNEFRTVLAGEQEREQLRSNPQRLRYWVEKILKPYVDFEQMTRLVMGSYWRGADSHQRERFSNEFHRLLLNTYATAYNGFRDWEIRFLPARGESGAEDVLVRTEVLVAAGPVLSVEYRMHQTPDGWKAYDVAIEGISLVTNYRSVFMREIRKRGLEGFLERLKAHNNQVESQFN